MNAKLLLGSIVFTSLQFFAAASSNAQTAVDRDVEARRTCWMRVLGSTKAFVKTAEEYSKLRTCVKGILGRDDPYMVAMQRRFSVKPNTAGKVTLSESVAGFCYATSSGVKLTFSSGGVGRYAEGFTSYDFTWKQDGAQVQFTASGGNTFYFRHTTKHGIPALMKVLPDGREAGPYVRGKC